MEDFQIIELYWSRDQAAVSESNDKYGQMLKCISLGILSNHEDSEECVNDTYRKAWNTMPPQKPNNLAAYLGRIIRNILNNSADSIEWKDNFIKNAAENFYAHSFSVDFSNPKTGQSMAKWISDNTNGTLNPKVEINPEQILSILNTVYFYDEWVDKFDKAKTAEDVFHLSDSTTVNCDFMNRIYGSHYFAKGDGFTRSALSLKNAGSMIFILPDEGMSVSELISDSEKIREIFEGGENGNGEVVWQISKFNFGSKFDLVDTLKSFDVKSAFEQDADFSGLTNNMAFITNIRQETHIAIDENGVEASAFTQIDYAGAAPPQDRADMILNRPFIYGITSSSGTLLFVGICENPNAK